MPWLIESMVCVYLSQPPAEYINYIPLISWMCVFVGGGGGGGTDYIRLASPQKHMLWTISQIWKIQAFSIKIDSTHLGHSGTQVLDRQKISA